MSAIEAHNFWMMSLGLHDRLLPLGGAGNGPTEQVVETKTKQEDGKPKPALPAQALRGSKGVWG